MRECVIRREGRGGKDKLKILDRGEDSVRAK